jgi:hypothetical protein
MPVLLFIVMVVLLSLATPIGVSYLIDHRLHEGVNWFKRRRVLSQGVGASAKILSATMLMKATGSRLKSAWSIVYEVLPEGEAPFRAKGVEVMYRGESAGNRVRAGETVDVKFDPVDHTVVLVRADPKQLLRQREVELKEREEALLKGRR